MNVRLPWILRFADSIVIYLTSWRFWRHVYAFRRQHQASSNCHSCWLKNYANSKKILWASTSTRWKVAVFFSFLFLFWKKGLIYLLISFCQQWRRESPFLFCVIQGISRFPSQNSWKICRASKSKWHESGTVRRRQLWSLYSPDPKVPRWHWGYSGSTPILDSSRQPRK